MPESRPLTEYRLLNPPAMFFFHNHTVYPKDHTPHRHEARCVDRENNTPHHWCGSLYHPLRGYISESATITRPRRLFPMFHFALSIILYHRRRQAPDHRQNCLGPASGRGQHWIHMCLTKSPRRGDRGKTWTVNVLSMSGHLLLNLNVSITSETIPRMAHKRPRVPLLGIVLPNLNHSGCMILDISHGLWRLQLEMITRHGQVEVRAIVLYMSPSRRESMKYLHAILIIPSIKHGNVRMLRVF